MKEKPGPTLSYAMYDPPTPWGKYLARLFIFSVLGGLGFLAYYASENHIDAALYAGKAGLERKVILKQTEGEETVITHENRKWLSNVAASKGGE